MKKYFVLIMMAGGIAVVGCNQNKGTSSSSPITGSVDRLVGDPPASPSPTGPMGPACPLFQILLQIKPGFNPNNITYQKTSNVQMNGNNVASNVVITQSGPTFTQTVGLPADLKMGAMLKVDAQFSNTDGTDPISCTRSWTAVAENSIGCGPIEIGYQANDNSCVLVCN